MKAIGPGDGRSVWSSPLGYAAVKLLLIILGTVAALAVGYILIALRLVVIPVLIALLLAAGIRPLVHFLQRRKIPKPVATFLSLLACLTVVLGLGAAVTYSVVTQWGELTASSDIGLAGLEKAIARSPLPFNEEDLRHARESVVQSFTSNLSVGDAFAALDTIGWFVTALFVMIVTLFFFLKDGHAIWSFITEPLHGKRLARTLRAGQKALETLGGYLRGTLIIASIDAAGIGIAMVLLGVPLAMPLTAIVFLGGFVPVIGATVTGLFAVLVAYVGSGTGTAVALAVAVVVVQQLEGNLLQPVIMGKNVKLHPLVILLALTAGAVLAGIIGAVLAVPLTAAGWAIAKSWSESPPSLPPQPRTDTPAQ